MNFPIGTKVQTHYNQAHCNVTRTAPQISPHGILSQDVMMFIMGHFNQDKKGFGDLDLKKGVDHDLKLEKGEVWNKI